MISSPVCLPTLRSSLRSFCWSRDFVRSGLMKIKLYVELVRYQRFFATLIRAEQSYAELKVMSRSGGCVDFRDVGRHLHDEIVVM